MKNVFLKSTLGLFLTSAPVTTAWASHPVLAPGADFVENLCKIVESYQPGSQHYFACLNSGNELLAQGATGPQLVDGICESLADLFYDSSSLSRCYQDGGKLLGE